MALSVRGSAHSCLFEVWRHGFVLSVTQILDPSLGISEIQELPPIQFKALPTKLVSHLTPDQIGGLNVGQMAFSAGQLSFLFAAQVEAIGVPH